jgi:hypothetical protein
MAVFPCDYCGTRYQGPQQTVYPALVHNTHSVRERRRTCPSCLGNVYEWVQTHLVPANGDLSSDSSVCVVCDKPEFPRVALFATVYRHGEEREDWWGQACRGCVPAAGMALLGSQTRLEGLPLP